MKQKIEIKRNFKGVETEVYSVDADTPEKALEIVKKAFTSYCEQSLVRESQIDVRDYDNIVSVCIDDCPQFDIIFSEECICDCDVCCCCFEKSKEDEEGTVC